MVLYNKLVRDKIPEICKQNKQLPVFEVLEKSQYIKELNKKLQEELNEYLKDDNIEELADLEEVLRAILVIKGIDYKEFEDIRLNKAKQKGAFSERFF